ncbi:phage major tail tube protein [Burkholderia sp. FERM BP-3421]|uniref:phage major tail tube protein n=1 Tax=Burkholderia sp. FERM BP-3421 TaxID=1494466 RepID=UPI00209493E8|nr:phage major tail tube protein [Burkholderia sp. FERM BP-3421]WDD95924.1 phage major tail tube protein [Burkholderia sp. FERM BP-3421]
MGMPRKLKNYMLFNDGNAYVGQVAEITLPKLSRKMEDYIAGGMTGPIKVDWGQEAIQLEWTCGGLMRGVLSQWGVTTHDGVQLRFAGAYQGEDSARPDAVEIVIRGRHSEIDLGTAKSKEDTAFKVTTQASYYKLTINGQVIHEFDFINMVETVNGVDLLGSLRKAIGL